MTPHGARSIPLWRGAPRDDRPRTLPAPFLPLTADTRVIMVSGNE
jgi:hypothetical protein